MAEAIVNGVVIFISVVLVAVAALCIWTASRVHCEDRVQMVSWTCSQCGAVARGRSVQEVGTFSFHHQRSHSLDAP